MNRWSAFMLFVCFVFVVLLISVSLAMTVWHIMMVAEILPPLVPGQAVRPASLFLLFVSLVIGTAISAIGGDYFLRPLSHLAKAIREVAKGNFDVHVELRGVKELEDLAKGFNDMAKELGKIETLREDFVNNISHEFKTPLASIKGFAKLLTKPHLSEKERGEYLSIIISETERLSRLSSNVLLLSNLDNSSADKDRQSYSLDEQLRRATLLLEPQILKKQLDISATLDEVIITANEELLHHVWINLLENAIKFSHNQGIIKISLKQENTHAIVTIEDNGAGMDNEVQQRIFEKFYQGDSSRKTEGNGLGLALTKRIIALYNGRIEVASRLDKGTCFTISLPLN